MSFEDPKERHKKLLEAIRKSNDEDALDIIEAYDARWINSSIRHARWAYERAIEILKG